MCMIHDTYIIKYHKIMQSGRKCKDLWIISISKKWSLYLCLVQVKNNVRLGGILHFGIFCSPSRIYIPGILKPPNYHEHNAIIVFVYTQA